MQRKNRRNLMRRWTIGGMALALAASMLAGCQNGGNTDGNVPVETDPPAEVETKVDYIYELKYREVELYGNGDVMHLREPLIKLLANACAPVKEENGDGLDFLPPDPEQPSVAYGYSMALFDFDLDGVPELVVDQGGGSAGNAFYTVYDIMTGEELGDLDGGYYQILATYFNRATGEYETIINYCWRGGWMSQSHFVTRVEWGESAGFKGKQIIQANLMSAHYSIDAIATSPTEEETANGISGGWIEYCDGAELYVNGQPADVADYLVAQHAMDTNYVLISETALQTFDWWDLLTSENDPLTRATKMADILLGSDQKYVKP